MVKTVVVSGYVKKPAHVHGMKDFSAEFSVEGGEVEILLPLGKDKCGTYVFKKTDLEAVLRVLSIE